MDIQNEDWSVVVDRCNLTHIEITVAKLYAEKNTTKEYVKYITYGIPVLNEEAMGDVMASDFDDMFQELAREYTDKLKALHIRRRVHLDNVLKFGT